MVETFQERHQDYVIPLPTLPVSAGFGGTPTDVVFQFDPDAPFEFRSLAARMPYVAGPHQDGIQWVALRYTDSENDFKQDFPVPLFLMGAYYGQCGNPIPRYPNIRYPASSTVRFEVLNFGPAPLTGVQLFMRGVKLFRPGETLAYTYPAKIRRALPFWASLARPNLAILALAKTETRANQVFVADRDSDMVIRGGQAGLAGTTAAYEVFFTLRDETSKPFSNLPVHAEILFGSGGIPGLYPCGPAGGFLQPVGSGPSLPGLFFPEIYLPAGHVLLYDVSRQDAAYGGLPATADYPVSLFTEKVWPG
jgi:hypothetical protein